MSANRVIYNGIEMAADWPARIEAAQEIHTYLIGGTAYERIRYGDEEGGPFPEPCHDCRVLGGQYHVELICDIEECPRCHGQVIGCDCPYEGDETEGDEPATFLDRQLQQQRESLPAVDWKVLLDRIKGEIDGYTVFLETRDGRFIPIDDGTPGSERADVVGLVITWLFDGVPPWETEEPVKALAETLSTRQGLSATVQLSRSLESFVGYYIRVRPYHTEASRSRGKPPNNGAAHDRHARIVVERECPRPRR